MAVLKNCQILNLIWRLTTLPPCTEVARSSESCCGQGPFLLWVPPLWTAKALTYKGVEGSRVHALDTALTKKGPKIENGRMKVNGNKTITLEDLRTARKRTLKPVLKLQKCDMWGHRKFRQVPRFIGPHCFQTTKKHVTFSTISIEVSTRTQDLTNFYCCDRWRTSPHPFTSKAPKSLYFSSTFKKMAKKIKIKDI